MYVLKIGWTIWELNEWISSRTSSLLNPLAADKKCEDWTSDAIYRINSGAGAPGEMFTWKVAIEQM